MQKYKDELKIKKRKKLLFRLALFGFIGIANLVGVIYMLFFARLLDIRSVGIETPDGLHAKIGRTVDSWLDSDFWNFSRRNNILFFSADKLSFQLVRQFPKLESVKITKNFPHSLSISSGERKPVGIWCPAIQSECFYFDKDGIAFSETQPSAGFLIVNITDYRPSKKIEPGNEVIADDWFKNIIAAHDLLIKIGINAAEFIIPADSFNEFHAKTVEGWKIMFSNSTNIEKQISALATFLKEKIKPDQRSGLQYIDLRIQDRIYYK